MRTVFVAALAFACPTVAAAQTAEELVARNLQARGGADKIRAIQSLKMTGHLQAGPMTLQFSRVAKAPNLLRDSVTVQGMTEIEAYDGSSGWKISPFEGRKDPELLGDDDLRGVVEDADFYGPLVDYQRKDNRIEFLGRDTLDGDDVYRLKVTLANGDIIYYYLDPDTYLEIRTERVQFIRGAVRETYTDLGSYKQVAGVYFPFAIEQGSKDDPGGGAKVVFEKIEANVPVQADQFQMPKAPGGSSGHEEF